MKKYVLAELILIFILLLSVFIHRHFVFNLNPIIANALFVLLIIVFVLILLIIPAMIMLSARDKVSPVTKTKNPPKPLKMKLIGISKLIVVLIASWLIFFIGKSINNIYLSWSSNVVFIIGIIILYRTRKEPYEFKSWLIFLGLILITFILVLFLSGFLFSAALHI